MTENKPFHPPPSGTPPSSRPFLAKAKADIMTVLKHELRQYIYTPVLAIFLAGLLFFLAASIFLIGIRTKGYTGRLWVHRESMQ